MPNAFNVYLHATPAELAAYVLRAAPGEWNAQAIDAVMCGARTLRITEDDDGRSNAPVPTLNDR